MQPLVLLAGMNCTRDLWTQGGLDDALTPDLTIDHLDRQIDRLLDELPPVFVIGGLSLGAIVAMSLVVRAPHRVAGLLVAAANAKAPTDAQRSAWRGWEDRLAAGESPRALQRGILPALLSSRARAERPDLVERTLRMGADTPADALGAQLRLQATRVDLRPALRSVNVPTLVVSGAEDALCPPAFHEEIAEAVPGARLETVDAGHLIPLERPDAFGAIVRRFRTEVSRARSVGCAGAP